MSSRLFRAAFVSDREAEATYKQAADILASVGHEHGVSLSRGFGGPAYVIVELLDDHDSLPDELVSMGFFQQGSTPFQTPEPAQPAEPTPEPATIPVIVTHADGTVSGGYVARSTDDSEGL